MKERRQAGVGRGEGEGVCVCERERGGVGVLGELYSSSMMSQSHFLHMASEADKARVDHFNPPIQLLSSKSRIKTRLKYAPIPTYDQE